MKNFITLIIVVLPLLFACQRVADVQITLDASECGTEQACIVYQGDSYDFTENEQGQLTVTLPDVSHPNYVKVKVNKRTRELFITPGDVMTVKPNFNASTTKEPHKRLMGEGDNADINNYLNARPNYRFKNYYEFSEQEFIEGMEAYIAERTAELEAKNFSKVFTVVESQRIRFSALWTFLAYHKYAKHKNPELIYTSHMEDYILDNLQSNEKFCFLDEYKTMAIASSKIFALNGQEIDVHKNIVQTVEYAIAHFTNEKLINGMLDYFASDYIQNYSISNGAQLIDIYNENVTDIALKEKFNALVKEKTRLAKGQPSPVFNYADVDGNMVSLSDFKGKAVFIDLWATWCGPCCAEIPYIKTLEHEFEGKDIVFVSISLDKNKKQWKKMLESQKMGGVQLNFDGNRDFTEAYDSKSIPRFILIDADGNIVDSNAPRPSDPKLKEMIKSLI
ncbi:MULTISPECIES: TlpA family protein disulfide reductase [Carboxylicivirga]|uniref:TlpA family protein disulfide reductase n=1 Tax=Carboxylicivirga TaxID=1628153 RepID=UPI001178400A|nr:TlpA disulfide reductase family protein [Carboxylicivirga sp. M1479]TRX63307.1 TlpA family protein disulfide reductase [Carboxylicivirga sp. M1479]